MSKYVFNVGCPSIDLALQVQKNKKNLIEINNKYPGIGANINTKDPYIVVMQHPVTNEYFQSRIQIEKTLDAVDIS